MTTPPNVVELECSQCGKKYDAATEQHLCTCGKPLLARYDLKRAAKTLSLRDLSSRPRSLWRYREVLPDGEPVTLGEGLTALVRASRLGTSMGLKHLYVKDEGLHPTVSLKAPAITAAGTPANEGGARPRAAPTPGNAGGPVASDAAAPRIARTIG